MFGGVLAYILRDFHRTEVRTAHTAKMCGHRAFGGKGFVVEFAGGFGIDMSHRDARFLRDPLLQNPVSPV